MKTNQYLNYDNILNIDKKLARAFNFEIPSTFKQD